MRTSTLLLMAIALTASTAAQQPAPAAPGAASPSTSSGQSNPRIDQLKQNVGMEVDAMGENIQKMNDMVFSFAEPGFQEFETSKYLATILKQNGFSIQENLAGIPTAWMASWGSGKPVIALGSDIDESRRRRRSPASHGTSRLSKVRRATAKDTTPACRSRLPPRSRSRR
jgi:TolA-binding protein